MDTAVSTPPPAFRPAPRRINLRIVLFVGLLVFIFGSIAWKFLDTTLTGGIKDRGDFFEVDLRAMSDWEMDPVIATDNSIPAQFRALNGKRVQLVGEIAPGTVARGEVTRFELVYSVQKCCFEGPPKIQHFIKARTAPGASVEIQPGVVQHIAVGKLHVGIERDPENPTQVRSVYRFEVESMRPA